MLSFASAILHAAHAWAMQSQSTLTDDGQDELLELITNATKTAFLLPTRDLTLATANTQKLLEKAAQLNANVIDRNAINQALWHLCPLYPFCNTSRSGLQQVLGSQLGGLQANVRKSADR
jgi:hypothetical protein